MESLIIKLILGIALLGGTVLTIGCWQAMKWFFRGMMTEKPDYSIKKEDIEKYLVTNDTE